MATRELYLDKSCAFWTDSTPFVFCEELSVKLKETPYKGKYYALRKLKKGTETLPIKDGAFVLKPTVGTLEIAIVLFVDGKKQAVWFAEPLEIVSASDNNYFLAHPAVDILNGKINEVWRALKETEKTVYENAEAEKKRSEELSQQTEATANENKEEHNDLRTELHRTQRVLLGTLALVARIYSDPFGANTKNLNAEELCNAIGADLHPDDIAKIEEFAKGDKV